MTSFVQVNFFTTTISAALTTSDTSLSLGSTTGAPSIPSGSVWPLILTANDIYEVVYVTALSGSTATIERAQEGTTAQAWASGTTIYGAFTAGAVLYDGDSMTADDLTVTGTASLNNNVTDTGPVNSNVITVNQADTGTDTGTGLRITRAGSAANTLSEAPNINIADITGNTNTLLQQAGGQTEIWQYDAAAWKQVAYWNSVGGLNLNAPTSGNLLSVNGNTYINSASAGTALTVTGPANTTVLNVLQNDTGTDTGAGIQVYRGGSTANAVAQGPNIRLVDSTANTDTLLQQSGGQTEIWQYNSGWNQLAFWNTDLGLTLNAASSGYTLTVNGSVYAQFYNNPSDERLKSDIRPIDSAMARARQIRGVFFKWKSDNSQSAGVLAQEVQAVFPEAVRVHANGTLCVDQMALIGLLFAALGETEDQR